MPTPKKKPASTKRPSPKKSSSKKPAPKKPARALPPKAVTRATRANPAHPGPGVFAIHRLRFGGRDSPGIVHALSAGDLFGAQPEGWDPRVARSVYVFTEMSSVLARFEVPLDDDPAAASNARRRAFKVAATVPLAKLSRLAALASDGSAVYAFSQATSGKIALRTLDPLTLAPSRRPVPVTWLPYVEENYHHLVPAGPGLLCLHGTVKGREETLHLIDPRDASVVHSVGTAARHFVRAFHPSSDPSRGCFVSAAGGSLDVHRVSRADRSGPRLEPVASVAVSGCGVDMLDVGPCPPSRAADAFYVATIDTDSPPGVTVRRWLVRPDADDPSQRITSAGVFTCEDMAFDALQRTLCLGRDGQVVGCSNDGETAITWGREGFSETLVPVGGWANYHAYRPRVGSRFVLFGEGQLVGFHPPDPSA